MIKEIETESGTRISFDQTTKELGYSVAQISGGENAVSQAKLLIATKLEKINPGSGQAIMAEQGVQLGSEAMVQQHQPPMSQPVGRAPGKGAPFSGGVGASCDVQVEQQYVGFLL